MLKTVLLAECGFCGCKLYVCALQNSQDDNSVPLIFFIPNKKKHTHCYLFAAICYLCCFIILYMYITNTKLYQRASFLEMTRESVSEKFLAYCVVKGYINIFLSIFTLFFVLFSLSFSAFQSSKKPNVWNSIWFVYVNSNIFFFLQRISAFFIKFSFCWCLMMRIKVDFEHYFVEVNFSEVNINFRNEKILTSEMKVLHYASAHRNAPRLPLIN